MRSCYHLSSYIFFKIYLYKLHRLKWYNFVMVSVTNPLLANYSLIKYFKAHFPNCYFILSHQPRIF
ncbi:hypothetical protein LSA_04640 [Fructilactobacillus sanfranciscensis TMW 1.1304]|uniref:Uncharacterized protein n=1 Tax=Fructilactobacillus sanfranciscensis (strain TMW 1.1304) TaxID=714313 RepID=G2KV23_FRUST|nr:hypothetical protein LSA_04640 [Fructilactobacillus sanfranciscensis TMW 1.1304]